MECKGCWVGLGWQWKGAGRVLDMGEVGGCVVGRDQFEAVVVGWRKWVGGIGGGCLSGWW